MKFNKSYKKNNTNTDYLSDENVITDLTQIKNGCSPIIITIDGFLSESENFQNEWEESINNNFPNSGWYHLNWKSKKSVDFLNNTFAGNNNIPHWSFIISKFLINGLFGTWKKANDNSKSVGKLLAEILINNNENEYILMGHSLGGNVIYNCIKELSKFDYELIREVHILGGAVNTNNFKFLFYTKPVKNSIYNYYSKKDLTLKYLFSTSKFVVSPIGRNRVTAPGVININVTEKVSSHINFKKHFASYIITKK